MNRPVRGPQDLACHASGIDSRSVDKMKIVTAGISSVLKHGNKCEISYILLEGNPFGIVMYNLNKMPYET